MAENKKITGAISVGALLMLAALAAAATEPAPQSAPANNPCGMAAGDWCPAAPGDPCGQHRNASSCRADKACYGMPYQGESVTACVFDKRGFSSNCPAVGCTSTPPADRNVQLKRSVVAGALSDGISDPAKIAKYASDRGFVISIDEVLRIKAELRTSSK